MSGSLSRANPRTRPPGSRCTERKTLRGSICKLLEITRGLLSEQKTHTHTHTMLVFFSSHPSIFLRKKMQRLLRKRDPTWSYSTGSGRRHGRAAARLCLSSNRMLLVATSCTSQSPFVPPEPAGSSGNVGCSAASYLERSAGAGDVGTHVLQHCVPVAVPNQQHPQRPAPRGSPHTALARGHAECRVCSSAPPETRRTPSRKAPSPVRGRTRRGSASG